MAKLNVEWTKEQVEFENGQPTLYFLTSADPEFMGEMKVARKSILADENVAIATKFFNCVEIDGDEFGTKHPLYEKLKGRSFPRFVVIDSQGAVKGKLEGKLGPKKLYKILKKGAQSDYKVKLDKVVKDYRKMLDELDKIDQQKKVLANKERNQGDKAARKIAKDRDALALREKKAAEKEVKLLGAELKNPPAKPSS